MCNYGLLSSFTFRSLKFRSVYGCLHDVRALLLPGNPLLAATATVTPAVREDVIDMRVCELFCVSPNRPDIFDEVKPHTDVETDSQPLVYSLPSECSKAECTCYNIFTKYHSLFVCALLNCKEKILTGIDIFGGGSPLVALFPVNCRSVQVCHDQTTCRCVVICINCLHYRL